MTLELVPLSQREARAFVAAHHRHNGPDRGDIFRVGLEIDEALVAVGSAGRPKAAGLQDGRTIEITRVCTLGHENACSRLYGALCRAAAALGYDRVVTYTLASESGSSLRAAGFVRGARLPARDWAAESGRARYAANLFGERVSPAEDKFCWTRMLVAGRERVAA